MKTQTIAHLLREHDEIRSIVAALEQFLTLSRKYGEPNGSLTERLEPKQLCSLLDYLTEHLLMKHEEKEELHVLPALSRHGLSWSDTNLQHVRQEHRQVRYLMRSLHHAVHQTREWTRDDRRHFYATGDELVAFLRHHMVAEERHLFPTLDGQLDPEEDAAMTAAMDQTNRDFAEMPDAQRLQQVSQEFVTKYSKK